jgi:hypothetical protein
MNSTSSVRFAIAIGHVTYFLQMILKIKKKKSKYHIKFTKCHAYIVILEKCRFTKSS